MRNPYALISILLAGLIAFMVAGCAQQRESTIETAIERELPRIVGPADNYDVDVQGIRDNRGADRVIARGRRVRPQDSPVLDRVDITLTDVVYNPDRRELERVGRADGTVRVSGSDIDRFLEENRNLEDVEVRLLSPNQAVIRARPQIGEIRNTEVEVTGALRGDGPRLRYDVSRVRAGGLSLSGTVTDLLSDAINPIADLSSMPIVMQVTSVRVEDDAVIASITGRYP